MLIEKSSESISYFHRALRKSNPLAIDKNFARCSSFMIITYMLTSKSVELLSMNTSSHEGFKRTYITKLLCCELCYIYRVDLLTLDP